jgi:hypothetical protein
VVRKSIAEKVTYKQRKEDYEERGNAESQESFPCWCKDPEVGVILVCSGIERGQGCQSRVSTAKR